MRRYLIDNKCGVLKNELTALYVIKRYLARAKMENKKISFKLIVDFRFFDSFKLILGEIKNLFDKDLLVDFSVLITSHTVMNPKEFLFHLKYDAITLDDKDFYIINLLYKAGILKFKVNYKDNINTMIYIINYSGRKRVFAGTTSFSEPDENFKTIDLLVPINCVQERLSKYLLFFKKLWSMSETRVSNFHIIEYLKTFSHSEVIKLSPRNFIASLLKSINKDYLVKNISFDLSQLSEFQNMGYYSCIEKLEVYGNAIFSNSIGLSEIYISCMIVKFYYERNIQSLIITSAEHESLWEKNFNTVGLKKEYIRFIKRTDLQNPDFNIEKYGGIDFIVMDNAEYFSISKESNIRKKNIDRLLDLNKSSKVLMISNNIINDSLLDIVSVYNIFARGEYKRKFIELGIDSDIKSLVKTIEEKNIDINSIEQLKKILNIFMVKIEWTSLSTYFDAIQQDNNNKPSITTVKYAYDHDISMKMFEKIIPSISELNFEYTKLKFSKYEDDKNLLNWYKWRLCKKVDSSLIALIETFKDIKNKSEAVLTFIQGNANIDDEASDLFKIDQKHNIINTFNSVDSDMKEQIINNIKSDISISSSFLSSVSTIKYIENRDEKVTNLLRILNTESKPTIIFSESDDTIKYIERRLNEYGNFKAAIMPGELTTIEGEDVVNAKIADINTICNDFEDGKINVLITNDIIPEEIKLTRAKVIVNFDLPNNPSLLSKRNRKASVQPNVNKTKIYNFQSDKRVDKEIALFEQLKLSLQDVIAYFGIDFILWCIDEKNITDISENNMQELLYLTKDYKDFLSKKNTDEIKYKFAPALSNDDIVLREFIKYLNISEETLKLSCEYFKKPIFTTLKHSEESYYIIYKTNKGIKMTNNLKFSDVKLELDIAKEKLTELTDTLKKELLVKDQEVLLNILGIIRYTLQE